MIQNRSYFTTQWCLHGCKSEANGHRWIALWYESDPPLPSQFIQCRITNATHHFCRFAGQSCKSCSKNAFQCNNVSFLTNGSNWQQIATIFFHNKAVLEPRVLPAFAITYFCNHCNIRFENTSKYVDTLTLFSKNLNQRSLTPRWPLTPCLLRSHVWLYPRIIVSKSHDNTSMYVDTVINFAKYHIHIHTTYIHTTVTYYVQNEWSHSLLLNSVQARQKSIPALPPPPPIIKFAADML